MPLVRRLLIFICTTITLYFVLLHNDGLPVATQALHIPEHLRLQDLHVPEAINFRKPKVVDETLLKGPAPSTLGFDAIIAVSAPGSPRRERLIQAANITEIELTIPELPSWSEHEVGNFTQHLEYGDRETGRGSVMAWLSHTHILRWFLKSSLETMLVIEDDVDWDIRLRTVQIPRAAAAARAVLRPATTYWGNMAAWDVIWLGHCGDWFRKLDYGVGPEHQFPEDLSQRPHMVYGDPTMLGREELHPFTHKLLDALRLPEKTRAFHASGHPLCTFGYAINRASARKILKSIAPLTRPESIAFDAAMLLGCRKRGLRCFTVNPELFHHMKGDSLIVNADSREKVFLPPVDAEGLKQSDERNETSNIECGFWSGDFRFNTTEELEWLRNEVGRKGRCLKPGREGKPFDLRFD